MCFAKMDFRLGVKQDATMSKAILILTLVSVMIFLDTLYLTVRLIVLKFLVNIND